MKYKVIKLEDNKSVLVDESAEIKEGDWYVHHQKPTGNRVLKCVSSALPMDTIKIIASINHSIDLDVPMVVIEDEVDKWSASDYLKTHNLERGKSFNLWKVIVKGAYSLGFRAAQQKGVYSLDHVHKAIDLARKEPRLMMGEIIQSLKQEYIELETVEIGQCDCECHNPKSIIMHMMPCCNPTTVIKTTTDSTGQKIYYVKTT